MVSWADAEPAIATAKSAVTKAVPSKPALLASWSSSFYRSAFVPPSCLRAGSRRIDPTPQP